MQVSQIIDSYHLKSIAIGTYVSFIVFGGFQGLLSGWSKYNQWRNTRKEIDIGSELYNPVVNTAIDMGYWTHYVVLGCIGSVVIAGTHFVNHHISSHY